MQVSEESPAMTGQELRAPQLGQFSPAEKFSLSTLTTINRDLLSTACEELYSKTYIIIFPILQMGKLRHAGHTGNHAMRLDQGQAASWECNLNFLQRSYFPALN